MLRCKFFFRLLLFLIVPCCFCDTFCHDRHLFGFRY
jgi:hypothetical protein